MKVVDIAQEIKSELNDPTDVSLPIITTWLRNNIGKLNNALGLSVSIDSDTLEFSQELTEAEKVIFKMMYFIYYYDYQIRSSLGAAAIDRTLEVQDFGTTVRVQNKNELAKTWLQLRKETKAALDEALDDYSANEFTPVQVVGDDVITMSAESNFELNRITQN
jgi:hypothetical protein